jgi:hypothetical protein
VKQLVGLTADAKQKMVLLGENGEEITFTLQYMPSQEMWVYGLEYGDFKTYGNRLCQHPNLLRGFINILPFGLGCGCTDEGEPWLIDDFTSGRVSVYLLSATEALAVEADVFTDNG